MKTTMSMNDRTTRSTSSLQSRQIDCRSPPTTTLKLTLTERRVNQARLSSVKRECSARAFQAMTLIPAEQIRVATVCRIPFSIAQNPQRTLDKRKLHLEIRHGYFAWPIESLCGVRRVSHESIAASPSILYSKESRKLTRTKITPSPIAVFEFFVPRAYAFRLLDAGCFGSFNVDFAYQLPR